MVGEHIRALKGGRWMHAIDCGDETVLHLVEDAVPRRVRRAYRPEFVGGATAVELVTHRERTFPAAEIVRRAYSRASDPTLAAMFADSEAFAEWCTTGRLSGARNSAVEVPGVPPAPGAAPAQGAAPAKKRTPSEKPKARAKARPAARVVLPRRAKAKTSERGAKPAPASARRGRPKAKASPTRAKAKPSAARAKPARKGRR